MKKSKIKNPAKYACRLSLELHVLALATIAAFDIYNFLPRISKPEQPAHLQVAYTPPIIEPYFPEPIEHDFAEFEAALKPLPLPQPKLPEFFPVTHVLEKIVESADLEPEEKQVAVKQVRELDLENKDELEKIDELEKYVERLKKIPDEHVYEINNMIRDKLGLEYKSYKPEKRVETLRDSNSAVPFFIKFEKNKRLYLATLSVNEHGEYIIVPPIKPYSEISDLEWASQKATELLDFPVGRAVRDLSFTIMTRILDEKENPSKDKKWWEFW